MNKKETAFWGIENYVKKGMSLTEFQQGFLDFEDIDSCIWYGKNDIEESMEIYCDNKNEDDFYVEIDTKGNILRSYN